MSKQALLVEFLLAGFFAVACFRARSKSASTSSATPKKLFVMIGRLERLRMTRWQWCSMVFLLIMLRYQQGQPMLAELTALAQFILFLALPAERLVGQTIQSHKPLREVLRRP
jgi:hypothetical protein